MRKRNLDGLSLNCLDVARAANLQILKQSGGEHYLTCPNHDDKHPSLQVNDKKNVWMCGPCGKGGNAWELAAFLAGCDPDDKGSIVQWLREHQLLEGSCQSIIVSEYVYRNADLSPALKVIRYSPKGFRQQQWDGTTWNWKGQKPKLLYRLPELLAAPKRWVLLCEGEKDVDRLRSLGFLATCNPGGAGKWADSFTKALMGRCVAIPPHNDPSGHQHAIKVARELIKTAREVRIVDLPGLKEKEDVSDWLDDGHSKDELEECIRNTQSLDEVALQKLAESITEEPEGGNSRSPWDQAVSAPEFLSSSDPELDWLEENLLAPASITEIFSPRGIGKTLAAHALGIRLAKNGKRVLLLDRDNSNREVKRRLRGWGAEEVTAFKVMTRDQVPPLTDAAAWRTFPFHDYELVIIDSLDATAEGVGEQDSRQPSKAIAPILDIAHRADGPAILVLGNTIKSAQHSRGSGVVEDRADIVFEVRDATDLQPSGTKDWWLELPPSGAEEWAKRASRRKKRDRSQLAFVPSKFRVGEEPEPFLLEVDLSGTPWGLQDVTDAILQQGKEALNRKQQEHEARLASAAEELIGEVEAAAQLEKTFIAEQDGLPFLMERGLKRKEARQLIKDRNGVAWRIETLKKERGRPRVLVPLTHLQGDVSKGTAAENEDPENPLFKGVSDPPSYAAPMDTGRRKTTIPKPLPDKGFSDSRFTPPTSRNSPDPSPGEGEKGEYWEGQLE